VLSIPDIQSFHHAQPEFYRTGRSLCQPSALRAGGELAASRRRYTTAIKPREEQVMNEARRQVETPVEARAGFLDRPVLVVLCVSLALGIVVLGALWFGFFAPSA
jgi:hypothetical protein